MPPNKSAPRIAVGPGPEAQSIAEGIHAGGGRLAPLSEADAVVWVSADDAVGLAGALEGHPDIRWVQLSVGGIEEFAHLIDRERVWTCCKGAYAEPVAEMVVALAGMRSFEKYPKQSAWRGTNSIGADVTILGGGGVTRALLRLLQPFDCRITVVRNRAQEMQGASLVLEADRYIDAIAGADLVVLALALTPETVGIIGASELELMGPGAWLVNVAHGKHLVTDDLVEALRNDVIGGAGLDVTDPEPLPDGHPLWSMQNCIVTPHVAVTAKMAEPLLAKRVTDNVRRWVEGADLIGRVDPDLGY